VDYCDVDLRVPFANLVYVITDERVTAEVDTPAYRASYAVD